ncbi:uncharacterized protein RJT21DRAFT_133690 [Scheffersomyces amazonensis]|uniref:uncharacterized protein n=1 Tax=Scheffersomyces amazonensis TaxID=1078765 RepID=UPI00315D0319
MPSVNQTPQQEPRLVKYKPARKPANIEVPDYKDLYSGYFYISFNSAFDQSSSIHKSMTSTDPTDIIDDSRYLEWKDIKFKMLLKRSIQSQCMSYDMYRCTPYINNKFATLYRELGFDPYHPIHIHENDFYDFKSKTIEEVSKSNLADGYLTSKQLHYKVQPSHVQGFTEFMLHEYLPRVDEVMKSGFQIPKSKEDVPLDKTHLQIDSRLTFEQIFKTTL